MRPSAKRFLLVFGVWTVVAICEGGADYLAAHAAGSSVSLWSAFRWPLTEQWIWAGLTPLVFLIAHRFPLSRHALPLAWLVHVVCFLALSFAHCATVAAIDTAAPAIPTNYHGSVLGLRFLQEIYSDIWMYWPLVCIQALIDSNSRSIERERFATELQVELANSRLALLRAQIQPHFLFNTLHAITSLIGIDARAAEDMVADLAVILRASFANATVQETTLRSEMALVDCYLRIQCRRFDWLRVSWHVAPECLGATVPALVLQSLVENAVVHGVAPANRLATIDIRVCRNGDQLVLTITDDGVGLRKPHRPGFGLANTQKRLQQLYAGRQSMAVSNGPRRGVVVTVAIPFRGMSPDSERECVDAENANAGCGRRSAGAPESVIATGA